ncbi:MAG: stage VI sporulation protein F [Bacilli bacterium]
MDEKIFDKVEEKTNVKREDIINLAKSIQGKDMNNERNLRKLIQDVAKLAGKTVSKEKEEKIIKAVKKDQVKDGLNKML